MSSLYPSLEDMKVDQIIRAQNNAFGGVPAPMPAPSAPSQMPQYPPYPPQNSGTPYPPQNSGAVYPPQNSSAPYPPQNSGAPYPPQNYGGPYPTPSLPAGGFYPGLGDYMGLELTEDVIRVNMPEYLPPAVLPQRQISAVSTSGGNTMIAPLSSESPAFAKSQITHGIRQLVLCKGSDNKVGFRVKSINKGVFVCLVTRESPAAIGGLRFGDQILEINGESVAGYTENKVNDIIKKAGPNNIGIAVRDRPFERTLTLHKDSAGQLGFQFKEGKINAIAVNSSAARNGVLIEHNLLEVNGQNVIGVKDKDIGKIIDEGGQSVTITVIPTYLYDHMMKNMSSSLVKKMMDHSIPDM